LGPVDRLIAPFAGLADRLAARMLLRLQSHTSSSLHTQELDAQTLVGLMSRGVGDQAVLRPVYDVETLRNLLADSNQPLHDGRVHAALLRLSDGRVAGWFVYAFDRTGMGEVLQIAAQESYLSDVGYHLFSHACRNGVAALAGRLEPHSSKAISGRLGLLSRREHAMLVHSRDPQILSAIHLGRAFISRLEGEWCLRFH
jgi:hypothetical protein